MRFTHLFVFESVSSWVQAVTFLDPLTYSVEVLRGLLIGVSHVALPIGITIMLLFDAAIIALAGYLFSRTD